MKPECPNLIHPKYYTDPATGNDYEGSYMCELVDKYCLVEYGSDCETYSEFLKEENSENQPAEQVIRH